MTGEQKRDVLNASLELVNSVENELKNLTLVFSRWKCKVESGYIDSAGYANEEYERFICQLVTTYDTICSIFGYDSANKTLQALKDAMDEHQTLVRNHITNVETV
jgi:hypothetical protein